MENQKWALRLGLCSVLKFEQFRSWSTNKQKKLLFSIWQNCTVCFPLNYLSSFLSFFCTQILSWENWVKNIKTMEVLENIHFWVVVQQSKKTTSFFLLEYTHWLENLFIAVFGSCFLGDINRTNYFHSLWEPLQWVKSYLDETAPPACLCKVMLFYFMCIYIMNTFNILYKSSLKHDL